MSVAVLSRLLQALIAGVFLFSPSGRSQAGEPPLPLEAYWELVERSQAQVMALGGHPERTTSTLDALEHEWAAVTLVSLPDGRTIPVDHAAFVSLLQQERPDLELILHRLNALLAARETWPADQHTPETLGVLKQILSQPEFQYKPDELNFLERWWQQFWDWVFTHLFGDASWTVTIPAGVDVLLVTGGSLLIAIALYYALRGISASWAADVDQSNLGIAQEELVTSEGARHKATLSSQAGDYRSAVRYLYLSALLLLEERGILRYDRTKTNREYLASVSHSQGLFKSLRSVVDVFDRVWYGDQGIDDSAYQQYADEIDDLRQMK